MLPFRGDVRRLKTGTRGRGASWHSEIRLGLDEIGWIILYYIIYVKIRFGRGREA